MREERISIPITRRVRRRSTYIQAVLSMLLLNSLYSLAVEENEASSSGCDQRYTRERTNPSMPL